MHAIGLDRGGCNGTRPMLGCLRRGSTFAARARATHISAHGFNRGRSGDWVIDDANPFVSAYAIQNAGSAFRYPCERFLRDSLGGAAPYSLWTDAQLYGDCRSDRRAARTARGANACAKNPLALITPCHRVIQKNGRLGGYRWGVARKAALLALENRGNTHARAQNLFTILLRTRDTGSGGARNPHIYQICSASCAPSFPV